MKTIKLVLMFLGCFYILIASSFADEVEIFSPETDNYSKIDINSDEYAELTIYLKSFGDLVYGYKIFFYNNDGKLIGQSFSDVDGIAIFTKIPAGKYRVAVEKKVNERGGPTMISVGDMKLKKTNNTAKILKKEDN